jgi:ABC-type Mn2+/Zn2+ transport system permease subunit
MSGATAMLERFLDDWQLFGAGWLAGWLIAVVLAQIGVLVVARGQVFIGAAVSQASALGIALALALAGGTWLAGGDGALEREEELVAAYAPLLAVAFSVLAALLTAGDGRAGRGTQELVTGWIFLFCASVSILAVSHSHHGSEEIHRLLFSSIVGAGQADVWIFGIAAAVSVAAALCLRRRLLLVTLDPVMASTVGMRTARWSLGIAAWLGLVIGLSMETAGLLYTFGCLMLPAVIARNVNREVAPMLFVAPAVAVAATACGFLVAHDRDYPPAQMAVACLSVLAALSWAFGRLRRALSRD